MLAGISVSDEATLELAGLLHTAGYDETADRLVTALEAGRKVVALTIEDRTRALEVLDGPPEGDLAHLRAVLVTDLEWRRRAGL
jgi:hypothetical protein